LLKLAGAQCHPRTAVLAGHVPGEGEHFSADTKASRPGIDTYPPGFGRSRILPLEPKHARVTAGRRPFFWKAAQEGGLLTMSSLFSLTF
jgi:hypothetical protein